jgi:hypothetical protein
MNTLITLFSIAAAASVLCQSAAQAAHTHVRTCGGLLNVTEVEVNPTTVYAGDDITLSIKVANGYAPITDGLFYYHVADQTTVELPQVDFLCDVVSCPIRFGRSQMKLDLTVPQIRSGGHVRVEMTTKDMTQLLCVQIEIEQTSWLRSLLRTDLRLPLIAGPAEPVFGRQEL